MIGTSTHVGSEQNTEARGIGPALPAATAPVHRQVWAVADREPASVAVQDGDGELTYGDLRPGARRLAAQLTNLGCHPGGRVAVVCEPSIAMVVALLGVLEADAAYVPVDLSLPNARIQAILSDASVSAVVADGRGREVLGSALPWHAATEDLAVATLHAEGAPATAATGDAAYVIYTSGTTGEPKGVVVGHAQLTASTTARELIYPGTSTFLLVSPLAFDSSVAGIWGTLTAGGRLIVASAEQTRDVEQLVGLIAQHGVTRTLCIPSLYGQILDLVESDPAGPLSTLDTVIVAGEPLPERVLRRHFAIHRAGVALVNEYGPTEATVFATYRRYLSPGPVTIGHPIPGARLYVLDEQGRPAEPGVEGELYIGGAGVADGYLGRPEATARAFLPDPFAPQAGARMFRTGDMVRWTADGELCFVGRRDHQVKIRGHRVELGAVEAELRRVPRVKDAVVLPNPAATQLTAFVTTAEPTSKTALRQHLAERLPPVMVPATFHTVPQFPLTPNGKVDRDRLAETLRSAGAGPADDHLAQVGPTAKDGTVARVSAAWAQVLKIDNVPADVNFFDLGGHSLAMFQLQDALEHHTGTRPSIVALFRHTTVAEQASYIDGGSPGPAGTATTQERARAARTARIQRAKGGRSG
ncbi:non-ribosomal peptide synthetase [Micromonospora sp. KC721]|uniref:non-ribosomal peptide synthetase n=1 Tax=Micromonospora sp. KC721 TaxID=2530380 RepID=UPI001A9DFC3E|nr:non-ribosomal peptide synthetase [Micromonospora sp. KC721]